MTKLDPITSEEVLTRQVKEQAAAEFKRPIGTTSRSDDATANAAASSDVSVELSPDSKAPMASATIQEKISEEAKRDVKQGGFYYSLPLGCYLLAFMYVQVLIIVMFAILHTIMIAMQQNTSLVESVALVQREIWGVVVISAVFAFFIASGNNILRIMTVAGSSLVALFLGVQLGVSLTTFLSNNSNTSSSLVDFLSVYSVACVFGVLLMIVTVIYLLRPKVIDAYN